jgi:hypothetical protein
MLHIGAVADNLDLNVVKTVYSGFFHEHGLGWRLGCRCSNGALELIVTTYKADASSPTTIDSLDHDRIPDGVCKFLDPLYVSRSIQSRQHRNIILLRQLLCLEFVTSPIQDFPTGPDDCDANILHALGEFGTFT